jgi:RNA polymerase sigma factor (TIGR02999 family)
MGAMGAHRGATVLLVSVDPQEVEPREAGEVTVLLGRVREGDAAAKDRLFELVYAELRGIARRELARRSGGTLSATALVHEAFLKLERLGGWSPRDRPHFLALASRAMRQILVDASRLRVAGKRGGAAPHVALEDRDGAAAIVTEDATVDVLAVHQALVRLAESEPELAQLVEWRFFGGFSVDEIAAATGVSDRTIKRNWRTARAFLYRELTLGPPAAVP